MHSKMLDGIALVCGMCLIMYALFSDNAKQRLQRPADPANRRLVKNSFAIGRSGFIAFGVSLLAYGVIEVMLRSR